MTRMIIPGLLWILTVTTLAQVTGTNEPLPGTREYYAKYVEGRYRCENGRLVPVSQPPSRVVTGPGVVVPATALRTLAGKIVQMVGTNEVVVRTSRRVPSGAEKCEYAVLRFESVAGISVGQEIATNVVYDGSYKCVLASGGTNTLAGYRLPENQPMISFDEYLDVFKKDSQTEPLERVTSVERIIGETPRSYVEALRQRREAMLQARANQAVIGTETAPQQYTGATSNLIQSANVVGYGKASAVSGTVVRLKNPSLSSAFDVQKETVDLRGVFYTGECSVSAADEAVFAKPEGNVEEVIVGGTSLALLQKEFAQGCIVAKDFGNIPVMFKQQTVGTNTSHRCILTFSDEQLARLRKQGEQDSKREVQQSK